MVLAKNFSTMLHKNAHKIIVVLIYAYLEWILIFLLLLNSFFSYLIKKFATYFGLKPPCILCSTLDKSNNSFINQELVCEEHAKEISKLNYSCPNGCSSNQQLLVQNESFSSGPWLLFKPSWDILHYIEKRSFKCLKAVDGDNNEEENKAVTLVKCDHNSIFIGENQNESFSCGTNLGSISNFIFHAKEGNGCEEPDPSEDGDDAKKKDIDKGQGDEQQLQHKMLIFDKKEAKAEGSLDGISIFSEVELGEGSLNEAMTIEQLKSELKARHKALRALYEELEAERNAAAVATNETMAMITKLQEEKAAMQMEASQYQRMMEEQSEYDQEALQLLNDLMIKREKEKQQVEKEMEIYRKKVSFYEAKEKMMMMMRKKCASIDSPHHSSASSVIMEGNENLLINKNLSDEVTDCFKGLSTLDKSVEEFEEERLSILEELKELEVKLLTMVDDEERLYSENDQFTEDDPRNLDHNSMDSESKTLSFMANRLLPLFDATASGLAEGESNEENIKLDSIGMNYSIGNAPKLENNRLAIVEEISHVYERLHNLEADNEFLRYYLNSLKNGDKGIEILQNLRDFNLDGSTSCENVLDI